MSIHVTHHFKISCYVPGMHRFGELVHGHNLKVLSGCCVGTMLNALCGLIHLLIIKTLGWYYEYPQFIDEETDSEH